LHTAQIEELFQQDLQFIGKIDNKEEERTLSRGLRRTFSHSGDIYTDTALFNQDIMHDFKLNREFDLSTQVNLPALYRVRSCQ
jgi:hypothetical protein